MLKVNNTATSMNLVTIIEDEKKLVEAVKSKMAVPTALVLRIAATLKVYLKSCQKTFKPSPAADTSGQKFPCCCC